MAMTDKKLQLDNNLCADQQLTCRAMSPAIEGILYKPFKVLDHGFIRVIDYMGNDSSVVQAARVSYGRGTKQVNQDKGLIDYLMRHRHTTPFEMCEIKFHVKLPIFVARQWIRHRTASLNEYSARYSVLAKEFYLPAAQNLAAQSSTNRQGRDQILSPERAAWVLETLKNDAEQAYAHYQEMLNLTEEEEVIDPQQESLARELARMNLSLNFYTEWYWKINLHNLFHFISLRNDSHAQYEIRMYAEILSDIVREWVPLSHQAFSKYRMNSVHLSAEAVKTIHRLLKGEIVRQADSRLSSREWKEFIEQMGLQPYVETAPDTIGALRARGSLMRKTPKGA